MRTVFDALSSETILADAPSKSVRTEISPQTGRAKREGTRNATVRLKRRIVDLSPCLPRPLALESSLYCKRSRSTEHREDVPTNQATDETLIKHGKRLTGSVFD